MTEYGSNGTGEKPVLLRELIIKYGPAHKDAEGINGPADVARIAHRLIAYEPREIFLALYFDARHRLIGHRVISIGSLSASLVHPREVFSAAILANAGSLIVVHNHPSGDASPSRDDLDISERLRKGGELLGIKLLDSIIIAEHEEEYSYYSIREELDWS